MLGEVLSSYSTSASASAERQFETPVHRLEALVHMAVVDDEGEGAQLLRLVARHHRQIRVLPIAEHPEALEVRALRIDLLVGVLAAGGAKCLGIELLPHPAMRFLDLHLDRQPMTVPAGHIRRIVAVERARLDDDVLEDLVDGVPQVDRAVGVRRPVRAARTAAALGRDRGSSRTGRCAPTTRSIAGSRFARSAFMGNPVLGRLIVFL